MMEKHITLEMENKMIGLTGVARSGKDTFYSILKKYLEEKGIKSQRLAFADALKNELYDCTPENKEIVRPLMVAYGKCRRIQTEGKYWTSTIQPEVNESIANNIVPIVTDVRYIEYKEDEYSWLKSHNGILIHISRKLDDGSFVPPANIEEKSNDNKLKAVSDISIVWETCQDVNFLYELMQKQLKNVYERYLQNKKII